MEEDTQSTKKLKTYNCFNKIGLILSVSFLCFSVGMYFGGKIILRQKIHENIQIKPGSNAYKFWSTPPATILRKYYLFDVRNPIEVQAGEKPILVQRGPYVYSEHWEKRHVTFLNENMMSFTPVVSLKFEPELSAGMENDSITFVNIPALGLIEESTRFSEVLGPLVANGLFDFYGTTLFVTKTAGELINGYEDPLMKLAKQFLPSLIKDDKFSLVNGKNGTEWQNYTMMTGVGDMNEVAKIISWNGVEKLSFWGTDAANLINGSDGTFYPPFRSQDDVLYAFSPDMCRSYKLKYLNDGEDQNIRTINFHLPSDIFHNTPENAGFCEPGYCLGDGVLNISKCYGGISGFISQPHFLNADPKFREPVVGLKPDTSIHDFVLRFEPTSGVPVSGNIRLQISFYMFQNPDITLVKNVKSLLLPIVWFDDAIKLHSDTASELATVQLIADLINIVPLAFGSLGTLLIVVFISVKLYLNKKFHIILLREKLMRQLSTAADT